MISPAQLKKKLGNKEQYLTHIAALLAEEYDKMIRILESCTDPKRKYMVLEIVKL